MTGKTRFTDLTIRNKYIVKQKDKGTTNKELARDVSLSIRAIQKIYKHAKEEHCYTRKKGSGRPVVLSKSDKIRIRKTLEKNPYYGCSILCRVS